MKYQIQHLITLLALLACVQEAVAQGTAFTYQGRLSDGSAPANGSYDLRFVLYDNSIGGSQQGPILTNSAIIASNGLFSVTLDFANQFSGAARWLEIAARTNGGGSFITLSPRQMLTPSPYAITSGNLSGGTYSNAVTFSNAANIFSGNGGGLTTLNASNISSGTVADARLSANVALLNAGQTFSAGLNTFGDIALQNSSASYHHLALSGGNSLGYLYGSYAALGDGVHFGYNYYADAQGSNHIINPGGGTSRISAGYGYIELFTGSISNAPHSGLAVVNGEVGIGTTTPKYELEVNGYISAHALFISGSDQWAIANGTAPDLILQDNTTGAYAYISRTDGSYHQSSDLRLKRDITNLENTLDRLVQLRPVSYHLRRAPTNAPLSLGLIAQEVQPLFPEVVGEGKDGMKDIAYSELVPVTIRSIQELNQKLEAQTKQKNAEIQYVKRQNELLSKRLDDLEKMIKMLAEN